MRKKLIVLGILVGLLAGALAAPAGAKKKPKKPSAPAPVAQPVPTTMYLDGEADLGEEDGPAPPAGSSHSCLRSSSCSPQSGR